MPPDNDDSFNPGIDSPLVPGTVEVNGVQTDDPEATKQRVAEQTPFDADAVVFRDGEVGIRERARDRLARQRAAANSPFPAESFDVEGGEVEAPDPTERLRVTVFDDDISGDVEIVNERTGERRDLGADAGGDEPFGARIDAPDRKGEYEIQVGGETVDQFRVGAAGAAVDRPGNLAFGWNGAILDADRDNTGVEQREFDPNPVSDPGSSRRAPASRDPDVVAGAGAGEALQAGIPPEILSGRGPISERDADRLIGSIDDSGGAASGSGTSGDPLTDQQLATRGSAANRRLRNRIAGDRAGLDASQVDLVDTPDGLAFQRDGDTIATEQLAFGDARPGAPDTTTAPPVTGGLDDGEVTTSDESQREFPTRFGQRQRGSDQEPQRGFPARFGERQRRRGGGQTVIDRAIERAEDRTGVDVIPGEGDVVQETEQFLSTTATDIREGETILPSPDEAEEFGADAAAATAVGGSGRDLQVLDATLDREEAARGVGGSFARTTAQTANVPATILGAGRTAEAAGETGFNLAAGFGGRALDEQNVSIGPLDRDTEERLADAGLAAGDRGREQLGDATRGAVQGVEDTAERTQENPAEALGTGAFIAATTVGGTAASTAATRGLSALPDRVRSVRARRQADARVDLEDITTERGVEGEVPLFDIDRSAPTSEGVREVEDRARDNPDAVLEAVDEDRALFQSTKADLGPGFEARRGSSELSGLFTSPDVNPKELDVGGGQSSLLSTNVRLPRARDFTSRDDRLAAFPGDRVEGFPEDATGSGRIPDGDGGFEPDPSTSGTRFLDEQAEEGTAFVRPQGGRTPELEAIFPPGSEFGQTGSLAVDLPSGRTVPLDAFRRAEDLPDGGGGGGALGRFLGDERGRATLGDDRGGAGRTMREINDELRRLRRRDRDAPEGEPVTPVTSTGGGPSGTTSTGLPTLGDLSSSFGAGSGTSAPSGSGTVGSSPSDVFDSPGGGVGSGFGSSGGGDPSSPSGFPSPSGSPSSSPSSPGAPSGSSPSGPGSPSASPDAPSGGTPSAPVLPGSPSTPQRQRDDDDRRDEFDAPFARLVGERSFASGIADAEEAAASFFGGDREFSERPPTDTDAEDRAVFSSTRGVEDLY